MSALSNAEIVALGNAVLMDENGVAVGFDHTAVEQIVARHVAAALTEAADAIEHVGGVCSAAHGDACVGGIAYRDAARIVRSKHP